MGRPRKQKPINLAGTLTAPDPKKAHVALKEHAAKLNPGATARRVAEAAAEAQEAPRAKRSPSSAYRVDKLSVDPLKAIVFDQLAPDSVLGKVRDEGRVTFATVRSVAAPIVKLAQRSKSVTPEVLAAAQRYESDTLALGVTGSPTDAIINTLTSVKPDKAREKEIAEAEARGTGYGVISGSAFNSLAKDPSDKMLGAAFRLEAITGKLDGWEKSVLDDLIVRERTVGMIAQRWGVQAEAMSLVIQLALWKLARVYEEADAEFQAWLSIQRQADGSARE